MGRSFRHGNHLRGNHFVTRASSRAIDDRKVEAGNDDASNEWAVRRDDQGHVHCQSSNEWERIAEVSEERTLTRSKRTWTVTATMSAAASVDRGYASPASNEMRYVRYSSGTGNVSRRTWNLSSNKSKCPSCGREISRPGARFLWWSMLALLALRGAISSHSQWESFIETYWNLVFFTLVLTYRSSQTKSKSWFGSENIGEGEVCNRNLIYNSIKFNECMRKIITCSITILTGTFIVNSDSNDGR